MTGSIMRRGKHSWRIKFDVGRDADGKRQTRYATVRGSKKEAEIELTRLLNDVNRGILPRSSKLTLSEHLDHWLDVKGDLSPLSREHYRQIIDSQIKPTLGGIELQKLTPANVQNWLVSMREGKRGRRSPRSAFMPIACFKPR